MKYLKLFSSVKIVKGYNRTLMFDSRRDFIRFVPNSLFDLLSSNLGINIEKMLQEISLDNKKILEEYLDFLINNKLGFYCNSLKEFQNFEYDNREFASPNDINYLIIDLENDFNLSSIICKQIIDCKIKYLQIRFCTDISVTVLENVLKKCELLNDSFIEEISFVISFSDELYSYLIKKNLSIQKYINVIFHSCDNNISDLQNNVNNLSFDFIVEKLIMPISCGIVKKCNFVFNEEFYLESQNNNTCLNKKIAIDSRGNIKNCPSMKKKFGNIASSNFKDIIRNPDFIFFWNLNKDQVSICKDCEFRHVCMDCRAYLEEPEDHYSKPLKCGYDPYQNTWEDWSMNPLKKRAIEFYGTKL
ncbi:grasp-with-spasm system SPASM domain peptide maturase [Flavobacterium ustbae]|uniref:grasp-with-spasm system SPASM domain peptide maturase n=1 Tax=Flavobacterium ustbae TaxID=2488790 RepID=UPI000F77E26D|nr:grasp-with-spasm system SPASM domain peptide maturase [Flavobacterium ustbae]